MHGTPLYSSQKQEKKKLGIKVHFYLQVLHEKGFALLDVWPVTFDMRTKMPVGVHAK
jgi:hypothetical protein